MLPVAQLTGTALVTEALEELRAMFPGVKVIHLEVRS